ncbi:hypothetical protein PLESTF_000032600 [Pleodorina starrii]|nr:hypothetical protein PLESTF_000032600 [Pleodorina starrii]
MGSFKGNSRRGRQEHPSSERAERDSEPIRADGRADVRRRGRDDGSLRQCNSCGCTVPSSGWEQHVNGIRHRRNQASVTLMGEPGHMVRSIFEPDPADIPDTYRGKDPVALRAQQLRQLMVSPDDDDDDDDDMYGSAEQEHQRHRRYHQPPRQQQPHPRRPADQPASIHPQARPALPQRRRPHSDAFAELQARREQRLLAGGRAAVPPPPAPSDSSSASSSSGFGSSSTSSSSSEATISDSDLEFNATGRRSPRSSARQPSAACQPQPLSLHHARPPRAAAAAAVRSARSAWCPDEAQVSGLVAAVRREAVHHTGLGPLYQAVVGQLDAAALRRRGAVELLGERLERYRRRLDAWLRQQQQQQQQLQQQQEQQQRHRDGKGLGEQVAGGGGGGVAGPGVAVAAAAPSGPAANAGGRGGDVATGRPSDSGSDSDDISGHSGSDEEISSGSERMAARRGPDRAAVGVTGQPAQRRRQRWRRPYLRLGPAELLLLSIHPGASSGGPETTMTQPGAVSQAAAGGRYGRGSGSTAASASAPVYGTMIGTGGGAARRAQGPPGASTRPLMQQPAAAATAADCRRRNPPLYQQPRPGAAPAVPRPAAGKVPLPSAAQSVPAPAPPLRHLYLEVPFKPHGREAAAYATAMGVLLAALRRERGRNGGSSGSGGEPRGGRWTGLEAFGLRFSREDYLQVLAQGGASRLAPLESLWQLAPALVQLMQACTGCLRELRLCCPPGLLGAEQVESLQRAAVDPRLRNQRRLAVLMGSHARLGAASPLHSLPREVVEVLLDLALPRSPHKLVLGLRKWMPGSAGGQHRRRAAAPEAGAAAAAAAAGVGGGGLAAAAGGGGAVVGDVWAAPAAAAGPLPPPQQLQHAGPGMGAGAAAAAAAQQQQQLPLDVRVAARHAARR